MSILALNVYQIYNLFDIVSKENEEIISMMHTLEKQTINVEEKHLKIERKVDQLLGSLKWQLLYINDSWILNKL